MFTANVVKLIDQGKVKSALVVDKNQTIPTSAFVRAVPATTVEV